MPSSTNFLCCDCICLACCGACAAALFLVAIYFFFGVIFTAFAIKAKNALRSFDSLTLRKTGDAANHFHDGDLYLNLCISIGVLFTLLTILGLCGEKRGKKARFVYAGAQLIILILGLVLYIGLYPADNTVEKYIYDGLTKSMSEYGQNLTLGNANDNITAEWDKLQINSECCGITNYQDWEKVKWSSSQPPIPISCCHEDHRMGRCTKTVSFDNPAAAKNVIFVQGCYESVRAQTWGQIQFLDYFLIPILIITGFGCLLTCCSTGVDKNASDVEEKKFGPMIVRRRTSKKKTDAENPLEICGEEKKSPDEQTENNENKKESV